ncbi:hypothetical protein [Cohnella nanjingensis]|uniref:Uncharacterized protein n=1 Tax=Cohnella nanjingensis TaxID=1387779 RepID=A0A7X0RN88_9BACL|nr:hypothetical protein [Cohnella nanjingensis]MBB6669345.1 hypothetical protein [Cohnella nanjingensis]
MEMHKRAYIVVKRHKSTNIVEGGNSFEPPNTIGRIDYNQQHFLEERLDPYVT